MRMAMAMALALAGGRTGAVPGIFPLFRWTLVPTFVGLIAQPRHRARTPRGRNVQEAQASPIQGACHPHAVADASGGARVLTMHSRHLLSEKSCLPLGEDHRVSKLGSQRKICTMMMQRNVKSRTGTRLRLGGWEVMQSRTADNVRSGRAQRRPTGTARRTMRRTII